MPNRYQAFETLKKHQAILHDSVHLGSGMQLAAWSNKHDIVTQEDPDHHTLSLYIADGYECYHKTRSGWQNGGGPDRFCLMPKHNVSSWDVRGDLSFVHMYCTDEHLRKVIEQTWDRSPASLLVDEITFREDAQITQLYRHFLLSCQWQENSNQLMLSSATNLLVTHLARQYTQLQWALPTVRGGLSPSVLNRVKEYIHGQLAAPLQLAELAEIAGLSEFHFARMFKQSMGIAPHQYVMNARIIRAESLLYNTELDITTIALDCGFSSTSHFSNRFKSLRGVSPSTVRQASLR
ncbi:AraC family transcriptional regulator [Rouxiella silvae]|uniref:AraC family transcriptional regulator n=1 Tax=Rouxiella silvae TaxID=1646373 RepID=A0AA40X6A4_9GAMM|nr:AraC family transcriptional regulator [Rouxiella silvae]KQN49174.1 AraC family transcriptional regulator [Serratia sp. Leaf50]MBF6639457.1 helix-turn-helix transcriptional regulator [Rouxiella silvae]ORJ20764.1 AraC family transcriptional regulator [Rouxiella silvae]